MKIIFIRHPQSTKNVEGKFSSTHNNEPLTQKGLAQAEMLYEKIAEIIPVEQFQKVVIYSATSARSLYLAETLAQKFNVDIHQFEQLNSIKSGSVSGLNQQQMDVVAPGYFMQMQLYEKGVINAYDIKHPGEPLRVFERNLDKLLSNIIDSNEVAIVIAHKSAITASLIGFARKMGVYPKHFFGYIAIDTASVSVIDVTDDRYTFKYVNLDVSDLTELGAGL